MKNIDKVKKYCLVLSMLLCASCMCINGAIAEPLTASTSLTIVHLTKATPQDISRYTGAWPEDYDDLIDPDKEEQEVYISSVNFGSSLSWATIPTATPYSSWPNGINSILTAVWSKDGGKTFELLSWDYLGPYTSQKHIEGMPDCWMGTMVSTLCGQKAGECNGEYRSNLYFTEYPSGNANCWGTVDLD